MESTASRLLTRRALLETGLLIPAALTFAPIAEVQAQEATAVAGNSDWPVFRGSPAHTASIAENGPVNLAPAWIYQNDSPNTSNPVVDLDKMYIMGDDSIVWAIDRATGAQRWATPLGGTYPGGTHSVPVIADGLAISGSGTGFIFALDVATGSEVWRYDTGDVVISPPNAVEGVVYAGSNSGFVYALNVADGSLIWKCDSGPIYASSATIGDGRVYIGTSDGEFLGIDASNGVILWKATAGRRFKTSAYSAGMVFAPSFDGHLYALDAATGEQKWQVESKDLRSVNNPAILGDTVVVTIDGVGAFAYSAFTGTELWARADLATDIGSAVIAGGVLYVSALEGQLLTLDLATGKTLASFDLGVFAGAPAIADGKLYIVANDGRAYSFEAAANSTPVPLPATIAGIMPTTEPLSTVPPSTLPVFGTLAKTITFAAGPDDPLKGPVGIAFGAQGEMYLVDSINNRIVVFGSDGTYQSTIGKGGTGPAEFAFSSEDGLTFWGDIELTQDGSLFVTDPFNARLQRIAADGTHIQDIRPVDDFTPFGLAIDANGVVYASDFSSGTVMRFTEDGDAVEPMGAGGAPLAFAGPTGIATDDSGNVWVVEIDQNQIIHVGKDSTIVGTIGRFGIADGRLNVPLDIAIDASGRFFVTDSANHRIQVFAPDGTAIGIIGENDGLIEPTYLVFGPGGSLYVSDDYANKVNVYTITS